MVKGVVSGGLGPLVLAVLGIAGAGGFLFYYSGLYLPWMLGPLFFVMAAKMKFGKYMQWNSKLRNAGLIMLGLQLGSSFTSDSVAQMAKYLPVMFFTTVIIILFTVLTAIFLMKRMKLTLNTSLLGSFPGGLSQMVVLSEEIEDADESIVAFMQTLRIILVISIVPWLVVHVMSAQPSTGAASAIVHRSTFSFHYSWMHAILMAAIFSSIIFFGKKINFPLPFMLGPLLTAAAFNLTGFEAPQIPVFWLNLSQLLIGAHLGYTLKVNNPRLFRKMFGVIFVINVLLIGFCYLVSNSLKNYLSLPANELFLSLAPGGVAEMSVTALSVHSNVSIVTSFHLFRILFILFLLSPVMKFIAGRRKSEELE
ncbi:AbrB family transcriptional regulator [Peribacillus sp. B-H-3]|uniref:AbrB family transcriptional regulator n=1 Tax=Peribacillus sp. B-H-3 TaxID=3400420 RepID=UPI003B01E97D